MADELARRFEFNASKFKSAFEEIFQKYDRDFPDDDIVELRQGRIISNRGVLESMKTKKVGYATFGKHGHPRAGTYFHKSWMEPEPVNTSLDAFEKSFHSTSEKSFISANCSRWVTNIEEESEPSDAETLTSSSEDEDNSDSWEDETEETIPSEESEVDSRHKDADLSVSDDGFEEDDSRLTIGDIAHHIRQSKHSADRETQHEYPHQTSTHKTVRCDGFATACSPESPKHKHHTTNCLLSGNSSREALTRPSPKSRDMTPQDVMDRIGPPRRVKPVLLFSQNRSSTEVPGVVSKEARPFKDIDILSKENSFGRKVFSETGRERDFMQARPGRSEAAKDQSACQSYFSSRCNEVDICLPCSSPTAAVCAHRSASDSYDILTSQEYSAYGADVKLDKMEKVRREPHICNFSERSPIALESTFTLSRHNLVNAAHIEDKGTQMQGDGVISTTLKDDEWRYLRNKDKEQNVREQECRKSGAKVLCAALTAERRVLGAQTCFAQSRRMEQSVPSSDQISKLIEQNVVSSSGQITKLIEQNVASSSGQMSKLIDQNVTFSSGQISDLLEPNVASSSGQISKLIEPNVTSSSTFSKLVSCMAPKTPECMQKVASCSSQFSKSASCAAFKTTDSVPSMFPDSSTETCLQSAGALVADPDQEVNLRKRELSLLEIRKDLDRLSAMFSSVGSLIQNKPSTPITPSRPLDENEVSEQKTETDVVSSVQPEMMEVFPVYKPNEKPEEPFSIFPDVTTSGSDVCKKSEEHACEKRAEVKCLPADKTFIVSDQYDQKRTNTEADQHSACGPFSSVDFITRSGQIPLLHKPESKAKRKFCPAYMPISTKEIEEFLEIESSRSFINFLKEKHIMNQPESVKKSDSSVKSCSVLPKKVKKEGHAESSQINSGTKPCSTNGSFSSPYSCRPEVIRDAECCHVIKDNTEIKRNDTDVAALPGKYPLENISSPDREILRKSCACHDPRISDGPPKVAESNSQIQDVQTAPCFSKEIVSLFQFTPGHLIRDTIRSQQLTNTTKIDLSTRDSLDENGSVVKKGINDRENQDILKRELRDAKEKSHCKASYISDSRSQIAKSAQHISELESEPVTSASLVSCPAVEEKQMQLSGSAVNSLVLQMKRSTSCKTPPESQRGLSNSLDEQKDCYQCHKNCFASIHLSKNSRICMHKANPLNRADSPIVVSDRYGPGQLALSTASGDNPLSWFSRMDTLKTIPSENIKQETNIDTELPKRETGWSKVTVTTAESSDHKVTTTGCTPYTEKLSRSTPVTQETEKDSDADEFNERVCIHAELPSHRIKISSSPVIGQCRGISSRHKQSMKAPRALYQTGQNRAAEEKSDARLSSYSSDSLSVTPEGQSLNMDQSSTPSKLMNKLNLSDPHSPFHMTKHCNKLSKLLLDSSEEKKVGSTTISFQSGQDRQLKQNGSDVLTADQTPQSNSQSWKIFKSTESRLVPHIAALRLESPSCYKFSSPRKDLAGTVGLPILKEHFERKMIRISSPKVRKMASSEFSLEFPRHTSSPCKRSFQPEEVEANSATNKQIGRFSSPLKRRRIDPDHGTSTPNRYSFGRAKFDMNESLSTIAGEISSINSTVHSSEIFPLDDGDNCSEEEDEVSLIPE